MKIDGFQQATTIIQIIPITIMKQTVACAIKSKEIHPRTM